MGDRQYSVWLTAIPPQLDRVELDHPVLTEYEANNILGLLND